MMSLWNAVVVVVVGSGCGTFSYVCIYQIIRNACLDFHPWFHAFAVSFVVVIVITVVGFYVHEFSNVVRNKEQRWEKKNGNPLDKHLSKFAHIRYITEHLQIATHSIFGQYLSSASVLLISWVVVCHYIVWCWLTFFIFCTRFKLSTEATVEIEYGMQQAVCFLRVCVYLYVRFWVLLLWFIGFFFSLFVAFIFGDCVPTVEW